ncbi:DUF4811 domain-containing protein [Lactobacillus sp. PSON]|uniref:DUF4811 domain-containing protein n=1 Tax=Lactobacillus sp. PSON TaxID=3455454 RepID=UPI004041945D
MIILILIIAAISFIYFNVIPGKFHTPIAWISLIITTLSIVGIVAHDYNHYGMKEKTVTVTKPLASSANKQLPILLYQPLGNGTEKVYLYKNYDGEKKPKAISTEKMSAKVVKSKNPTMTIKTTTYVYKNTFSRLMFGIFKHNNELKNRQYTFKVPNSWHVLSVKQAKNLQKEMAKKQALLKKQMLLQKKMQQNNRLN